MCKGSFSKYYDIKLFLKNDRIAVWQLTEDKHLKVQRRQDVTVFPDMFMLQRHILPFFRRQVIMSVMNECCERIL